MSSSSGGPDAGPPRDALPSYGEVRAGEGRARHAGVLTPWGIDERGELLYRTMLRHPQRDAVEMASMLGWTVDEVGEAMAGLLRARLVRENPGAGYVTASPHAAIESLLAREERILSARQQHLEAVRAAIPEFAADHLAGQSERATSVPVDLVAGPQVGAVVSDIARTTTGEILCVRDATSMRDDMPVELAEVGAHQLREGRGMRAVYPASVVEDEGGLAYIRFWAGAGEESRLAREVPTRFLVFGGDVAVLAADWDGGGDTELVVRVPALVRALRELFERMWVHAVPVPYVDGTGAGTDRGRILELLALGAKDETIARHLGLSVRTVRRRVAAVMESLGATTRFQAGAQAARQGLV